MSPGAAEAPGFHWRTRGYLFAGAGAVFLVLAIAARDAVLVLLAVPLLVAPVASALASPRPMPRAALAWRSVGVAGEVRIVGEVKGDPPRSTDDFSLAFERPADLSEERPPRVEWWPGAVRFELRWSSPRPTVQVVPAPSIVWHDPIGLVERGATGPRAALVVERYPLDLHRLGAVRLERTRQLPGKSRTRNIGVTGEFFGIREATRNEPPRRINWRASARSGKWLANEFEVERTGDLIVLIDARPTILGEVLDERFLGVARAAATGISGAFLRQKTRLGYASFGEFLDAVPLSTGRTQGVRIRRAIRATRRGAVEGPSERCAVSLRRFYPAGVTTILLSSLGGDAACDLVVHLRHRGYPVVVLNPSWRSLVPPKTTLPPREDALSGRLAHLERQMRLVATRAYASVVDWEDLTSLGDLALLLQRPDRRRA
ncbi:MAG TPA: DUF58 domain-containing protein [Thermoplasmata archaeon]|nr:DUF58 domain-containing protein [Thermoplasmata archaeon]